MFLCLLSTSSLCLPLTSSCLLACSLLHFLSAFAFACDQVLLLRLLQSHDPATLGLCVLLWVDLLLHSWWTDLQPLLSWFFCLFMTSTALHFWLPWPLTTQISLLPPLMHHLCHKPKFPHLPGANVKDAGTLTLSLGESFPRKDSWGILSSVITPSDP